MSGIELGQVAIYRDKYDASLLEPIPRQFARSQLNVNTFFGFDMWHAYELSWLAGNGVPQTAIAEFSIPAGSDNIVESKSFKYYLNSFNQTKFASKHIVQQHLIDDISRVVGCEIKVSLFSLNENLPAVDIIPGECLDAIDCNIETYQPNENLLQLDDSNLRVENCRIYSHLLKSNCPVTGQPDWATVWVEYSGLEICKKSLLEYVVSFRQYQGFHESCVERIFSDITNQLQPERLCVYARYTRRGGLDINPFRVSENLLGMHLPFSRTVRQ